MGPPLLSFFSCIFENLVWLGCWALSGWRRLMGGMHACGCLVQGESAIRGAYAAISQARPNDVGLPATPSPSSLLHIFAFVHIALPPAAHPLHLPVALVACFVGFAFDPQLMSAVPELSLPPREAAVFRRERGEVVPEAEEAEGAAGEPILPQVCVRLTHRMPLPSALPVRAIRRPLAYLPPSPPALPTPSHLLHGMRFCMPGLLLDEVRALSACDSPALLCL